MDDIGPEVSLKPSELFDLSRDVEELLMSSTSIPISSTL